MRKCRFCRCPLTGTEINEGVCSDCLDEVLSSDVSVMYPSEMDLDGPDNYEDILEERLRQATSWGPIDI